MSKNSFLNLNRIEFIVTYRCSGKCRHCSVAPKLNRGGQSHLSADKTVQAVETLSRIFPISSVMTFGGEPLLYPDVVCAVHRKAAERGIPTRQLITNGYFSKDSKTVRRTAESLAEAGLTQLLLSVDAFHQETIPLDAVHHFARCAIAAGIPSKLHPAWVVSQSHRNPYNEKTREILSAFGDLNLPVSSGNNIVLEGNAREYLEAYYERQPLDLSVKCGSMPYTAPLTDVSSLSIAPNGDVLVCGFVIGNLYTGDIAEIVSRYDPRASEGMRAVLEGGVAALLSYAKCRGIALDPSSYWSVCEICHTLAEQLAGG